MGSLITDLQADALDDAKASSDLLRKAMVIGTKLNIPELAKWAGFEMNGYPDANEVPEYRMIRGVLRAHNPYNGVWCEFLWGPKGTPKELLRRPVTQSVSALEQTLRDKDKSEGVLAFSLPSPLVQWIMDNTNAPFPPTFLITHAAIKQIVDNVRNRVLEWGLRLEQEGILGEGMTFSQDEKKTARERATVIIGRVENFQSVIGDINQSSVTLTQTTQITQNDMASLKAYFKGQGVADADLTELEDAIRSDPKPKEPTTFGPRVSSWMGKMLTKAASGAWQIGVGAAGKILADGHLPFVEVSQLKFFLNHPFAQSSDQPELIPASYIAITFLDQ